MSFLTLVWACTVADEVLHSDGHFRVKDKVLIFFHALIYFKHSTLCSCFVHCKLQVMGLILHLTVITISDIVWLCRGRGRNEWLGSLQVVFFTGFIGYEIIFKYKQITSKKGTKRNI